MVTDAGDYMLPNLARLMSCEGLPCVEDSEGGPVTKHDTQ